MKIDQSVNSVVITVGDYTFTFLDISLQKILDEWNIRDFSGCSSDQDGSVVLDLTPEDYSSLIEQIEKNLQ